MQLFEFAWNACIIYNMGSREKSLKKIRRLTWILIFYCALVPCVWPEVGGVDFKCVVLIISLSASSLSKWEKQRGRS